MKKEMKRFAIENARYIVLAMVLLLVVGAIGAGEMLHAYEKLWWWDDMLHTAAGFILGIVGFLLIYLLNARYKMAISPLLVAVFAFSFAISICVLWEIFEFAMDALFGTSMQQWRLPSNAILMGQRYQGSGLRDTMSDLIVAWCGATAAAVLAYVAYRHKKQASLGIMRRTFPWVRRR